MSDKNRVTIEGEGGGGGGRERISERKGRGYVRRVLEKVGGGMKKKEGCPTNNFTLFGRAPFAALTFRRVQPQPAQKLRRLEFICPEMAVPRGWC